MPTTPLTLRDAETTASTPDHHLQVRGEDGPADLLVDCSPKILNRAGRREHCASDSCEEK